jgi:hypothetical protein
MTTGIAGALQKDHPSGGGGHSGGGLQPGGGLHPGGGSGQFGGDRQSQSGFAIALEARPVSGGARACQPRRWLPQGCCTHLIAWGTVPALWGARLTGTFEPVESRPWQKSVRRSVFVIAVAVTGTIGVVAGVTASQTSEVQPHSPFRPMNGTAEVVNPAQNQRLLRELHYVAAHERPKRGQRSQAGG